MDTCNLYEAAWHQTRRVNSLAGYCEANTGTIVDNPMTILQLLLTHGYEWQPGHSTEALPRNPHPYQHPGTPSGCCWRLHHLCSCPARYFWAEGCFWTTTKHTDCYSKYHESCFAWEKKCCFGNNQRLFGSGSIPCTRSDHPLNDQLCVFVRMLYLPSSTPFLDGWL